MTKDCSECTETRSCDNYHVYVIELKKNVLKLEPSFPFEGELARGKRVYYVPTVATRNTLESVRSHERTSIAHASQMKWLDDKKSGQGSL